jgi:hypothetical protein
VVEDSGHQANIAQNDRSLSWRLDSVDSTGGRKQGVSAAFEVNPRAKNR